MENAVNVGEKKNTNTNGDSISIRKLTTVLCEFWKNTVISSNSSKYHLVQVCIYFVMLKWKRTAWKFLQLASDLLLINVRLTSVC